MFNTILFYATFYLIWTLNMKVLVSLIKEGVFNHPFWTRSMRSVFMVPPFAIGVAIMILLKDSIIDNLKNLSLVMKKRESEV
jgi:hypothetical protein